MSSDVTIRVDGLGKDYVLGERALGYATLRETLTSLASSVARRDRTPRTPTEIVRALDDLTFEVHRGETVGFIGHNGAGKSTLLKILSRITEPTRGHGEIVGRVGALLEVGTGFHPELTGRENIYLNGAILGMRKRDIELRFDQIAAFADVARFLDTPVKRYSSGMTVRLAFAVAAHLDPDVLIVDEVLAVGDTAFQRRCLDRMTEIARDGRTVLFVSHNMAVIQGLCQRGIVLERGRVIADAPIESAVASYLATLEDAQRQSLAERTDRKGYGNVRATAVTVSGPQGGAVTGAPATIEVALDGPADGATCVLEIFDQLGLPVAALDSGNVTEDDRFDGEDAIVCAIDELPLVPGRYRIDLSIQRGGSWQDVVHAAASFDVAVGRFGGRALPEDRAGSVALRHRWINPSS